MAGPLLLTRHVGVRFLTIMLTTVLSGCSSLRPAAVPGPAGAPPRAQAARNAARANSDRGLACLDRPEIDAWERRLRFEQRFQVSVTDSVARGAPYLERVREILEDAGLPPTLALLPVVESGFRPGARGTLGCRGLWQLRAGTARRFGLVVNAHRDDRLDPELATRAAARYLRLLHARYGDWPLALAAYNAGEGRVDRALALHPGSTFWALAEDRQLPHASLDYVSHFFAVVRIVEPPKKC